MYLQVPHQLRLVPHIIVVLLILLREGFGGERGTRPSVRRGLCGGVDLVAMQPPLGTGRVGGGLRCEGLCGAKRCALWLHVRVGRGPGWPTRTLGMNTREGDDVWRKVTEEEPPAYCATWLDNGAALSSTAATSRQVEEKLTVAAMRCEAHGRT